MSIPRWLKGKTPQVRGRGIEKQLAKGLGARVQPGSGAFPGIREDIKDLNYLYQVKSTDKKSIVVKLEDLEKLRENAIKGGREPVFVIVIGGRSWFARIGEMVE